MKPCKECGKKMVMTKHGEHYYWVHESPLDILSCARYKTSASVMGRTNNANQ